MFHSYDVFVDGEIVGPVKPYRTARFAVSSGPHRVWARLQGTGDAAMGDVVIRVRPGTERRVATTSRLKRIPPWKMLLAVVDTALSNHGSWSGFSVEPIPHVLLRAVPTLPEDSEIQDLDLPKGHKPPDHVGPGGAIPTTGAGSALAERIRGVTFGAMRRGYSPREVDEHFEHLATLVESGSRLSDDQVLHGNFHRAAMGYDPGQVDAFLQELATQLER
ncbi:MAG: DivIVA domain-containing protein [Acidimicrobiales bacterium]